MPFIAARERSFRRWLASWAIALATLVFGLRFALRMSQDAEAAVARWYGAYRDHFAREGDHQRARECEELLAVKLLHAQWLDTWVQNSPFRRWGG